MKTVQQVLGFVQGWQKAIICNNGDLDNDEVYQTLISIETYITSD